MASRTRLSSLLPRQLLAARPVSPTTAGGIARFKSSSIAPTCPVAPRRRATALGDRRNSATTSAAVRAYSSAPSAEQKKIWFFEDMQKLIAPDAPESSTVVIIDTREPAELQASGRIPGAVNIPITSAPDSFHIADDEFEDRFGYARPPRDADVVFYCKAGVRSRAAAELARHAGWTSVAEYPGSWTDWTERGGAVQKDGQ